MVNGSGVVKLDLGDGVNWGESLVCLCVVGVVGI